MTRNIVLLAASTLALAACGTTDRISQIGQYPDMSPIDNPSKVAGPRPVVMPMPQEREAAYAPNSLWQAGSRTFFNDQRADEIGDILTVNINITDSARVSNSTDRQRTSSGVVQLALKGVPPGEREFYYEASSTNAVVLLPGFVGIFKFETPIVWPP